MGFISLINYLEETFSITADDSELLEENFESINAIANYVQRKLQ
jgi:acyl carrier protein